MAKKKSCGCYWSEDIFEIKKTAEGWLGSR